MLVRASAVLKSQGRKKKRARGRSDPSGRVKTRALSGTHHAGDSVEENARGVASYDTIGPRCVWYSFLDVDGARALSQSTKERFVKTPKEWRLLLGGALRLKLTFIALHAQASAAQRSEESRLSGKNRRASREEKPVAQ